MPPNGFEALINHLTICPGVSVSVSYKPPSPSTAVTIQIVMDRTTIPSYAQEDPMAKVGDAWVYNFTARSFAPCEQNPSCGQGEMAADTSLSHLHINFSYTDGSGMHQQSVPFK
jgi:hypothetical protein